MSSCSQVNNFINDDKEPPEIDITNDIETKNIEFFVDDELFFVAKSNDLNNIPIPTKEGYRFTGWSKNKNFDGEFIDVFQPSISGSLYASFGNCSDNLKFELSTDKTYYSISGCLSDSRHVVIGDTYRNLKVKSIKDNAFENSKIQSVNISGDISIGSFAFKNCLWLEEALLSVDVRSIQRGAFQGCGSLINLTLPFLGETLDDETTGYLGFIFGASSSFNNSTYVPQSLRDVSIIKGENIYNSAFRDCFYLTDISLPNNLKHIYGLAFQNCRSWGSPSKPIVIPKSVIKIDDFVFWGCKKIEQKNTSIIFEDPKNWYRTKCASDWTQTGNEIKMDLSNLGGNSKMFTDEYLSCFWTKKTT